MQADDILQRRMPSAYIDYVAQMLGDDPALFEGTVLAGMRPGKLPPFVTVADVLALGRRALALDIDPTWNLAAAKSLGPHLNGPVTLAMISAPTLGDGFDAFVRYMPDRVPYFEWRRVDEAGNCCCVLRELIELGDFAPAVIEFPLLMLHEYLATLLGRAPREARVELRYPPPAYAAEYARWFSCPVRNGSGRNALAIPLAWRALRNPGHDEASWRVALARCEDAARANREHALVRRVRDAIDTHLAQHGRAGGAPPSLVEIARVTHVSPRTLIRRLRSAGTTYQQVVDAFQQARATALLAQPGLSVRAVGEALGFDDPSSFGRSFRRWFGMTPGEYRSRCFSAPARLPSTESSAAPQRPADRRAGRRSSG